MRRRHLRVFLLLCAVSVPELQSQSGAFVTRLGTDTLALETYQFSNGRLEGFVVSRAPRLVMRRYVVDLAADGKATSAEVSLWPITGIPTREIPPESRIRATFAAGQADVEIRRESTQVLRVPLPETVVPMMTDWWAGYALMVARVRAGRADSVRFSVWSLGNAGANWTDVIRVNPDSFIIRDQNQEHVVKTDARGQLMRAVRPAQQFTVERVSAIDLATVLPGWVARPGRGALGNLSPRDTLRASVAGAAITVDYSRPGKRGRVIFGGVVPWGQVWRTGANAATELTTDRPLELGGVQLAPGTYTITTIPGAGEWALILGAGSRELHRLPMQVTTLAQPVEQFTIAVTGGVLRFQWDTVEAFIPFAVR